MLTLSDYQLPVIASFLLFIAMVSYWISLSTLKSLFIVQTSKVLIVISNILFTFTLLLRWIKEGYFPLSNLYESLIFLSWGISVIHIFIEQKTKSRLFGALSTPLMFFLSSFSSLTLPIEMQKALPLVPSYNQIG
jgi:ABC-type transport system involved in cytochrome c biogenesis permease subunit